MCYDEFSYCLASKSGLSPTGGRGIEILRMKKIKLKFTDSSLLKVSSQGAYFFSDKIRAKSRVWGDLR